MKIKGIPVADKKSPGLFGGGLVLVDSRCRKINIRCYRAFVARATLYYVQLRE